jgi:hypothetical protein
MLYGRLMDQQSVCVCVHACVHTHLFFIFQFLLCLCYISLVLFFVCTHTPFWSYDVTVTWCGPCSLLHYVDVCSYYCVYVLYCHMAFLSVSVFSETMPISEDVCYVSELQTGAALHMFMYIGSVWVSLFLPCSKVHILQQGNNYTLLQSTFSLHTIYKLCKCNNFAS